VVARCAIGVSAVTWHTRPDRGDGVCPCWGLAAARRPPTRIAARHSWRRLAYAAWHLQIDTLAGVCHYDTAMTYLSQIGAALACRERVALQGETPS
jgi:hypothetical protein